LLRCFSTRPAFVVLVYNFARERLCDIEFSGNCVGIFRVQIRHVYAAFFANRAKRTHSTVLLKIIYDKFFVRQLKQRIEQITQKFLTTRAPHRAPNRPSVQGTIVVVAIS
jgi:hypothetical protein